MVISNTRFSIILKCGRRAGEQLHAITIEFRVLMSMPPHYSFNVVELGQLQQTSLQDFLVTFHHPNHSALRREGDEGKEQYI